MVHLPLQPTCGVQELLVVVRTLALVIVVDQLLMLLLVFWRELFPGVKDVLKLVMLVFTPELVIMLLIFKVASGLPCK